MFELNAFTWLIVAAWATLMVWFVGAILALRSGLRRKLLAPISSANPSATAACPLVSVLVPARNEEHRVLSSCIRSLLAQDYEPLEVIAVDDRSTDATKPSVQKVAATNPRLRVIEGAEPPAGWLGKPHALHQALQAARGEWVLATDADMLFEPTAVSTTVAHAVKGGFDAVTLLPFVECLSFWERVFMPTFGCFMLLAMPLERVNDPRRKEALGVGGFFLIRRSALERVGGYRAVRADVAEDLRMAELLKGSGARLRLEYGPDLIRTRMQTNLKEIWEGFTKNLFAGAKFSLVSAVAGVISVLLFAVAPILIAIVCAVVIAANPSGELTGEWMRLFVPTFMVWLIQVAIFVAVNRNWGIPIAYAFAVPLGYLLFAMILLNSTVRIATGSGVMWKGRRLYERTGVHPPRPHAARKSADLHTADE